MERALVNVGVISHVKSLSKMYMLISIYWSNTLLHTSVLYFLLPCLPSSFHPPQNDSLSCHSPHTDTAYITPTGQLLSTKALCTSGSLRIEETFKTE